MSHLSHPIIPLRSVKQHNVIRCTPGPFDTFLLYTHQGSDRSQITYLSPPDLQPTGPDGYRYKLFHVIFNEMHCELNSLLESADKKATVTKHNILIEYSLKYRAAIEKTCQEYSSDAFAMQELIWHLSEILYLTPPSKRSDTPIKHQMISLQLAHWIQSHGDHANRLLETAARTEQRDEFWNAVYALILQGRIYDCVNLLAPLLEQDGKGMYGKQDILCIKTLSELLKSFPLYAENVSLNEMYMKWGSWKQLISESVNCGELQSLREIEEIGKLLNGDRDAFDSIPLIACPRWIDMLVGLLLYCNPFAEAFSTELMERVRHAYVFFNASNIIDKIILNLFTSSLLDFFQQLCDLEPNWCIVAHLSDLLTMAGYQDLAHPVYPSSRDENINLNEFLVLGYANSLMSHPEFWVYGADYLMLACPQLGERTLATFLERIGASFDEDKITSVVEICERYNQRSTLSTICKVQARLCLRERKLPKAFNWCLLSGDNIFSRYVVQKYIWEYMQNGSIEDLCNLDKIGADIFQSEEITFIGKYSDFHSLYASGDVWSSAKLLMNILRSGLAPKAFYITLLFDALPLLELDEYLFTEEDTYDLMRYLQDITSSYVNPRNLLYDTFSSDLYSESLDTKFNVLRMSLTRNLSRHLFSELD